MFALISFECKSLVFSVLLFIVPNIFILYFFQPDLDSITHSRLLLEKNFYLNASNSKYLTIGIKPATKLHSKANVGFYVEIHISGKNMKPMSLGGLDGFMNLCQSLRNFEELKFTYPQAAANYDDIETPFPINISKKPYNGMLCFHIETMQGGYAALAQNSCSELLKYENLIVVCIKKLQAIVPGMETKFHDLVQKCAIDYATTIKEFEKSEDTFAIDIFMNFNELLRVCIDQLTLINTAATTSNNPAPKRKRASNVKRAKKSKQDDVGGDSDEVEVIQVPEEFDTEKNSEQEMVIHLPENVQTQVINENGQRISSELFL